MPRQMSASRRARIFAAAGGICHICETRIDGVRERWDADHVVPYALTCDDSDDNLRPAHERCHRGRDSKTSDDVKVIAKAKRVERKHIGAAPTSRHPLPDGRNSPWKRKIGGGRVPRFEG